MRLLTFPVCLGLRLSGSRRGPRQPVIDEGNPVPDENLVFHRDPFANEGVARYLAAGADPGPLLDLDKTANARVISNLAPVEIDEAVDADVAPQLHIGSDELGQ